jgi:hypothetical protein
VCAKLWVLSPALSKRKKEKKRKSNTQERVELVLGTNSGKA